MKVSSTNDVESWDDLRATSCGSVLGSVTGMYEHTCIMNLTNNATLVDSYSHKQYACLCYFENKLQLKVMVFEMTLFERLSHFYKLEMMVSEMVLLIKLWHQTYLKENI